MLRLVAVGVVLALLAATVDARQAPTPSVAPAVKGVPLTASTPAMAAPPVATPDGLPPGAVPPGAAPQPPVNPRAARLKSLQYDRKPSSILKAWALTPSPGPMTVPTEAEEVEAEMSALRRMVTLGQWDKVKAALASYPEADGKAAYKQMVRSLSIEQPMPVQGGGPMTPEMQMQMQMQVQAQQMIPQQYRERNRFSADDMLGLAACAPHGHDKETLNGLSAILRNVVAGGVVAETALEKLRSDVARPQGAALNRRQLAQILLNGDLPAEAGEFLPSVEEASQAKDLEGLNLLARHFLALHAKDKKSGALEKAWKATQSILALEGDKENKQEALKRAVDLAPKIRAELGVSWLEDSFTKSPEKGREILATLGEFASMGIQTSPFSAENRLKALELQNTAVDALLKAAPERADEWKTALSLLASNWLKEGQFSHQFARSINAGPQMNRDRYGNIYWMQQFEDDPNMMMNRGIRRPAAIEAMDVLANRPDDAWLAHVDETYRPKISMVVAQLHLKANEDLKAFPHIEELAKTHPQQAKELVNEFLRVWTRNHDPNSNRGYTNPYMFIYGFEMRANSIPLTRSKQERNLVELADLIARLKKMPIEDPDEELLAKAFTTCHSTAEVYKLETIESVFGPFEKLKAKTLSGLAEQMRGNLAGLWRTPREQTEKKTNRKQKDIQTEVLRGYGVAKAVVSRGIEKFPNDWTMVMVKAALEHDEANFLHEIEKTSEYAPRVVSAMQQFAQAAKMYAEGVRKLSEDEETTRAFEVWFYAALGAVDLPQLNDEKLPDSKQFPIIKAALESLPSEVLERHRTKFANQLFTRMSSVSPACKFRYLKAGFDIIGDHRAAHEAKKVYDYYKDLVAELKLEAIPDGSADVGSGQPFGVFVNLRHTREIERESGGFAKYLQNQNSGRMYYYNYGRPTADYRDKFQAVVTEAFKENFEVQSVTFQTEKVTSKAAREYGWRVTPYAYILLKARGPQVDKLPPVRLDLDFLDTSGYVVLPIESPAVPIDASAKSPPARPVTKLKITQILDERKAAEGILALEVKASGLGLVGNLDSLIDSKIDGFERVKVEDPGVSVVKFDEDSSTTSIVSERNFLVTYKVASAATAPKMVRFPAVLPATSEIVYQRYNDADLIPAQAEVVLGEVYAPPRRAWPWILGFGLGALLFIVGLVSWLRWRSHKPADETGLRIPSNLTPFGLLELLQKVERNYGFPPDRQARLREAMATVEQHYFANGDGAKPLDLRRIAEEWVR
jgi:hypothetical protein